MSDEPKRRKGTGLAIAVGAIMLLGTYVAGYFAFSERFDFLQDIGRKFNSRWMCRLYRPLGWCEYRLTGRAVWHFRPHDDADGAEDDFFGAIRIGDRAARVANKFKP